MTLIILVTIAAAGTSFLCSLMEASLYSIGASRIEELRQAGDKRGERLAKLREDIQNPISAILTLNTFANTAGASIAGSLVAATFPEYGGTAVGIYSAVFTVIVLFLSEIIPKTLGVGYATKVAPALSWPMVIMVKMLYYPFIATCRVLTKSFQKADEGPREEEILAMTKLGAETGALHETEARWAENALRLNDATAAEALTPRTVLYTLPAETTLLEMRARMKEWIFSKAPIYESGDPDKVVGVVYRREAMDFMLHRSDVELSKIRLRKFAHKPLFVPETVRLNTALRHFLQTKEHMAIVIDEFGGVVGVITLEDVIEYIIGEEIVDRMDPHDDMQQLAREKGEDVLRESVSPETPGEADKVEPPAPDEGSSIPTQTSFNLDDLSAATTRQEVDPAAPTIPDVDPAAPTIADSTIPNTVAPDPSTEDNASPIAPTQFDSNRQLAEHEMPTEEYTDPGTQKPEPKGE